MDINPSKCIDTDYIDFLIATSNVYSCTEAARCSLSVANAPRTYAVAGSACRFSYTLKISQYI